MKEECVGDVEKVEMRICGALKPSKSMGFTPALTATWKRGEITGTQSAL